MSKLLFCGLALLPIALSAPAQAQEVSRNWTGFYVGMNAGAGFSDSSNTPVSLQSADPFIVPSFNPGGFIPLADSSLDDGEGFILGGQIGYNLRMSGLVFGLEGDLSGATVDSSFSTTLLGGFFSNRPVTTHLEQGIDWLATLRGRVGFVPVEALMLYGTAGVAFAGVDTNLTFSNDSNVGLIATGIGSTVRCSANSNCFSGSESETLTGWTVGGGFEYALSDKVSLKGEYLFVDLGSQSVKATGTDPTTTPDNSLNTSIDTELHIARVGLNVQLD